MALDHVYSASPTLLFQTWFGFDSQVGGSRSGIPVGSDITFPAAGVKIEGGAKGIPPAVELLMSKSAAHVLGPPEVFRRAYGLVGRGLYALSKSESKEMGELHTSLYASLPPAPRERLGEYIDRARNRYATTPEEDRQMSQLMKSAVLSLPADKRARLQVLFEKAMTAGLDRP